MSDIDIGSPAVNRSGQTTANETIVLKENPANAGGIIDTIEVFVAGASGTFKVATFDNVGGDNFTTRDSENIGLIAVGYQTFSGLDMEVEAGDYLGFLSFGNLDRDDTGVGYWHLSGDYIPCTNTTFSAVTWRTISLYGTGSTPVVAAGGSSNAAKLIGAGLL